MRISICGAFVVSGMVVGCGAAPENDEAATSSEDALLLSDFEPGQNVRMMPLRTATSIHEDRAAAGGTVTAPAGSHLDYFGGPVLSSVKVYAVYWGANVALQSHLNGFYAAVTKSAYFDWLSEFDTPTQNIGRGSFGGGFVITPANHARTLSDTQIQKELAKQITANKLPKNDANTIYMVHFPPGLTITQGGGARSCAQFCAYHGTFKQSSKMVYYGVVPDQGGACAGGCGVSPLSEGTTEVSAHELIEAVTDPGVGLATGNGPPLGWYDQANGEIGDICAGQGDSAKVSGYTVQLEWSNARHTCVSH